MRKSVVITAVLVWILSVPLKAQQLGKVTIKGREGADARVSLVVEKVHFNPSFGVALDESEVLPLGNFSLAEEQERTLSIELAEPVLARLTIMPKVPSATIGNPTYVLYLSPGDHLNTWIEKNNTIAFEGPTAPYQQLLRDYFRENQYQYLPAFGFKPSQIKNDDVLRQSDSLQQLRTEAYARFRSAQQAAPAFDAYVRATIATEPYLIRMLLKEREMRRNRVTRLSPAQQAEVDDFTLKNFKLFPDQALMSGSYRSQLRSWILIPVTRSYPPDSSQHYVLSGDALRMAYQESKKRMSAYPGQQKYLLTYWLNYSLTAPIHTETGEKLLKDYLSLYPGSAEGLYFEKVITSKKRLIVGAPAPVLTGLIDEEGVKTTIPQTGKPACVVFNFNIRQHEPSLKALEDQYRGKVQFIFVTVVPGLSLDTWKGYQQRRPGVSNLWASDEMITLLKDNYAIDLQYPYLVLDGKGTIINRWIPLDFPKNAALERELHRAVGN